MLAEGRAADGVRAGSGASAPARSIAGGVAFSDDGVESRPGSGATAPARAASRPVAVRGFRALGDAADDGDERLRSHTGERRLVEPGGRSTRRVGG